MSLFSNKQMRIIFIYCVIIILVICGIITARHKQSSSENPANTSSITNEPVQVLPINPVHQMIQAALIRQFHQIPTDYRHTTHPIREMELAAEQSWAIVA